MQITKYTPITIWERIEIDWIKYISWTNRSWHLIRLKDSWYKWEFKDVIINK
jgi:hypothetical protein